MGWLDKYEDGGKFDGLTNKGFNYNGAWGGQFQNGGNWRSFLEPMNPKLPTAPNPMLKGNPSSEWAASIGGEEGEPAYLIPTFKEGAPLFDPRGEYERTGEHLGGPFKTWQEANKWDEEVRHPYVERGLNIPTPFKYWGEGFAHGGSMPGSVGFSYARTGAPSNGKYAKKTLPSAQEGIEIGPQNQPEEQMTTTYLPELIIPSKKVSDFGKVRNEMKESEPWEKYAQRYLGNFEQNMGQTLENLPEYRKQEYEDYLDKQSFDEYTKRFPKQAGEERGAYINRIQGAHKDSPAFQRAYEANAEYNPNTDVNLWRKSLTGIGSILSPSLTSRYKQRSPYYSEEEKRQMRENPISTFAGDVAGTLSPLAIPSNMLYAKNTDWKGALEGREAEVDPYTAIMGDPLNLAFEAAPLIGKGISAIGKSEIATNLARRTGEAAERLKNVLSYANQRIGEDANYIGRNLKGTFTGEAKKAEAQARQFEDEAYRLSYDSPEIQSIYDDERKLRKQKYDLQDKVSEFHYKQYQDQATPLTQNLQKKLNRQRISKDFTVNNEGLVQSAGDTALGLRTGSSNIMDLETGASHSISTTTPSNKVRFDLKGNKVERNVLSTTEPEISPEYIGTVKKNINFIQSKIPGAKVFGSATNVAESEIPHLIGDYDVIMSQTDYDKFAKASPKLYDNGFAAVHDIPGAAQGMEPIDINVIQEVKGKATGERATELFRQVAPDEFYEAAKQSIKDGTEIKIPYSSQELVAKTNPSTKSVVDAYESTKDKHLNKIDALINYGKPDVVKAGQQQYVRGLVGSKGSVGHQFPTEQLSDAETNLKVLEEIGFIGNKELAAKNPDRMQLAINDYYINNSILVRQVNKDKPSLIEAAIKEYNPGSGGGSVNGIGQNHVTLGNPGHIHGGVTSVKQIGLNLDKADPLAYIDSIKRQTSGTYAFTAEEEYVLSNILKDLKKESGIDIEHIKQSKNTGELIERLPYSDKGKKALYDFAKQTGKHIAKKESTYGTGNYASTLRDFDEAIDLMQYTAFDQVNIEKALKSYSERKRAADYSKSNNIKIVDELLPRQFKAIKSYLEEGHMRATDRIELLEKQRAQLDIELQVIKDKFVEKKLGDEIKRVKTLRDNNTKEVEKLKRDARELYVRKYELEDFRHKFNNAMVLGGGAATIGGILGVHKYMQSPGYKKQQAEKWKMSEKRQKENRDKKIEKMGLKAVEQDEASMAQKARESNFMTRMFGLEAGSGDPNYKKRGGGVIDDEMGQWAHPGEVTRINSNNITMEGVPYDVLGISNTGDRKLMKPGGKYKFDGTSVTEYPKKSKNGSELTKLDQLTNFTNYNTKQPGGWLDRL